jgi:(hydroxyamino)benzene mutase
MAAEKLLQNQSERLIFFGVCLFFLGLVAGLFVPMLANPRMGLSTHLEGVMNGILLMVLGLIWPKLSLRAKALKSAYFLSLYGSFANFAAVLIAAITGAGKMMPIAGGKEGAPVQEILISFLLISLSLAMVAVCILLMVGLYPKSKSIAQ